MFGAVAADITAALAGILDAVADLGLAGVLAAGVILGFVMILWKKSKQAAR